MVWVNNLAALSVPGGESCGVVMLVLGSPRVVGSDGIGTLEDGKAWWGTIFPTNDWKMNRFF